MKPLSACESDTGRYSWKDSISVIFPTLLMTWLNIRHPKKPIYDLTHHLWRAFVTVIDEIVAPFGVAHTYIAQTEGVPPPPPLGKWYELTEYDPSYQLRRIKKFSSQMTESVSAGGNDRNLKWCVLVIPLNYPYLTKSILSPSEDLCKSRWTFGSLLGRIQICKQCTDIQPRHAEVLYNDHAFLEDLFRKQFRMGKNTDYPCWTTQCLQLVFACSP